MFYWRDYKAACARDSKSLGKYVSPALAEHFAGYALRLKLSRYSNRSRHVSGSGLPTNWTNPSIGSVSKRDVELACPWKTLPNQAVQVQVFQSLRVFCPQLQAKKHRVLSLFTGVAGLELGPLSLGPIIWEMKPWRSGFLWPRFCKLRLAVNSSDLTSLVTLH